MLIQQDLTASRICVTSSSNISRIKVAHVETTPRNKFTQDKTTNAVLGVSNTKLNGYIIGMIDHLKEFIKN